MYTVNKQNFELLDESLKRKTTESTEHCKAYCKKKKIFAQTEQENRADYRRLANYLDGDHMYTEDKTSKRHMWEKQERVER